MTTGYGYEPSMYDQSGSESRQRKKRNERDEIRNEDLSSSKDRSGRSYSSRGERSSQATPRSRSRFGLRNAEFELINGMYNEDFKLMLAVSPSSDEAFCPKSGDYTRATLWHNKLANWQCRSMDELILRQQYASYFSVCLNQRQLRGVFQQDPPERLMRVDFSDVIDANAGCMPLGNESAWLAMASMLQHQGSCCNQSAKVAQTPSSTRQAGGSKYLHSTTHKLAYKSRPKLVPKPSTFTPSSSSATPPLTSSDGGHKDYWTSSSSRTEAAKHLNCVSSLDEQTRSDMNYLLTIIKRELRGEQLPEPDKYLEMELKYYREFYAQYRANDADFKAVAAAVDTTDDRVHMLLNMQNDLMKTINR